VSELQAFFHMGGYALYVWPAFLISFVVLLGNVLFAKAQYKRVVVETANRAAALSQKRSKTNVTNRVVP